MEGIIKIRKKEESKIVRGINLLRLSVQITNRKEIPGPLPTGDPDTEITLKSEDLAAIFELGKFFGKEHDSITF